MRKVLGGVFWSVIALLLAILALWGSLALWFRLPAPETIRLGAAVIFGLLGAGTVIALFTARRQRALAVFSLAFLGLVLWWSTIAPPATGNWSPDVSRQVTGTIDGDRLTLRDVRNFAWRTGDEFTEAWETRSYDLGQLQSLDLFMSYWGNPALAHMIISFGFGNDEFLAWSVEVRREIGSGFSPVADFFKTHTLSVVAADERDVVGVRSNIRGEDVQLYRLRTKPAAARALLEQYVRDANALAVQPTFYNSIFTNCTTVVFSMIRTVMGEVPLDWRIIVNGYLPEYAYDRGVVDTRLPLSDLRHLGDIGARAKAAGLTNGFPAAIRQGVPTPLD